MISQFAWCCVNRRADTAWDLALLRYKGRLLSWHILVFLLPIVQPMGPQMMAIGHSGRVCDFGGAAWKLASTGCVRRVVLFHMSLELKLRFENYFWITTFSLTAARLPFVSFIDVGCESSFSIEAALTSRAITWKCLDLTRLDEGLWGLDLARQLMLAHCAVVGVLI
jgi:hypothetical protein